MFEEINEVFQHKNKKIKSTFIVNRLLGFIPQTTLLAIDVNKYIGRIPEWAIRAIYLNNIGKKKGAPFIKYPKRRKKGKGEMILIDKVSTHLCCSTRHARETVELIRALNYKPEDFFGLERGK